LGIGRQSCKGLILNLLRTAFVTLVIFVSVVAQANSGNDGWNVLKVSGGGQITNLDYPTRSSPFLTTTDTAAVFRFDQNARFLVQLTILCVTSIESFLEMMASSMEFTALFRRLTIQRDVISLAITGTAESGAHVLERDNCNATDYSPTGASLCF
jgi:hypothetical protein